MSEARHITNRALEEMAQDCMRIIEYLRKMRHRAQAFNLPLAIPAERPFLELMSECARLKHAELPQSAAVTPAGEAPYR